jgi:hypothetical protein
MRKADHLYMVGGKRIKRNVSKTDKLVPFPSSQFKRTNKHQHISTLTHAHTPHTRGNAYVVQSPMVRDHRQHPRLNDYMDADGGVWMRGKEERLKDCEKVNRHHATPHCTVLRHDAPHHPIPSYPTPPHRRLGTQARGLPCFV